MNALRKHVAFLVLSVFAAGSASAAGNDFTDSFQKAKKTLENKVYFDHRVTLYCGAPFDGRKNIDLPAGFTTPDFEKRARRVEWEHAVPAENFGRAFAAWREGDKRCVKNGRAFKGRKCAELVDGTYRYMQADMYNLFPAIGAVNALRSNYRYTQFAAGTPSTFGSCPMIVDTQSRSAEPPDAAKGAVARATFYMAWAYPNVIRLSSAQERLLDVWNRKFPVDAWECLRTRRIEAIQGNENKIVKDACRRAGLW